MKEVVLEVAAPPSVPAPALQSFGWCKIRHVMRLTPGFGRGAESVDAGGPVLWMKKTMVRLCLRANPWSRDHSHLAVRHTSLMSVVTKRYTAAGGEAGTAPDDRPFRPDVQGLRAVAILLVVLYHATIPGISGGYVGVDVFFVISGFVITGVLLRERAATRRTSVVAFYSRRARRIIPAASLVIIVTVVAASTIWAL